MDNQQLSHFHNVISLMMFGFGDNQRSNPETVKIVENVVLKTLRDLLQDVSKYVDNKSLNQISASDIIFQLRHDRHKMQRYVKYLDYKLMKSSLTSENYEQSYNSNNASNKYETLRNFIQEIDETGELLDTEEFDVIKHGRQLRAERLSSTMDEIKYKEYTKARQASFFSKQFCQPASFRKWVDPLHSLNITGCAIEILELVAYNIIGNLVDMALIIRQNSKRTSSDPMQMLSGSCFNTTMFNAPHLPSGSRVNLGQPAITVREMREVVRRCNTPQVGYIKLTNKSMLGKRKKILL